LCIYICGIKGKSFPQWEKTGELPYNLKFLANDVAQSTRLARKMLQVRIPAWAQ